MHCTHFTLPWCNSSSNKNRILYHSINKWFTCPQASWRNKVKVCVKLNRLYITIYRKCIKSQSWSNTTFVHSLPFASMDTVNPAIYNMLQKIYRSGSTCSAYTNTLHIFVCDQLRIMLVTAHHVSSFIRTASTDLSHPDGRPCLKDVKLWSGVDGWTYISWSPSWHITNYATHCNVLTYIQRMWMS